MPQSRKVHCARSCLLSCGRRRCINGKRKGPKCASHDPVSVEETRPKEIEELELASAHYKEIIFQLKKKKELPSEKEIQGIIKRETD